MQTVDAAGYTWYWNHLVSFGVFVGLLYYLAYSLAKKKSDKVKHAALSAGICFVLLHLMWIVKGPWWVAPVATLAVGFIKEVIDRVNPKKKLFDWMDIVADLIGLGSVTLIYIFSFLL